MNSHFTEISKKGEVSWKSGKYKNKKNYNFMYMYYNKITNLEMCGMKAVIACMPYISF